MSNTSRFTPKILNSKIVNLLAISKRFPQPRWVCERFFHRSRRSVVSIFQEDFARSEFLFFYEGANKLSRPVAGGSVQAGVLKASVLSNLTSTATAP